MVACRRVGVWAGGSCCGRARVACEQRLAGVVRVTWVKLDDQFFLNPKSVSAGKDGRALYLAGLCYCASQLTDGFIATKALPMVAASAGVKISQARVLEQFGLWEEGIGGFWVHDYLLYNPKASEVRAAREKKAAAGALGGSRRAMKAQADAQALAQASATPDAWPVGSAEDKPPIPIPFPPQSKENPIRAVANFERGSG